MITINGKTYNGNSVSINNGDVIVDGKRVNDYDDQKHIHVVINGNVNTLTVDSCEKIGIVGTVGTANSTNGNVTINGDVNGDVTNKNGNVKCGNVSGYVTTKNGNIKHIV